MTTPVPTEVKRNLPPTSKEGSILTNMRIEPLRRLTATLISTPDLNSGQRRLGDWVMDELKVIT